MISIYNLQKYVRVDRKFVREIVHKTIACEKRIPPSRYDCNIIFTDNSYIKGLNKKYLNRNYSTDVIAFSMEEGMKLRDPSSSQTKILGDVFISVEKARSQAHQLRHSLKKEIATLAIHGLLHLMGYDDIHKKDQVRMKERTEQILKKIL